MPKKSHLTHVGLTVGAILIAGIVMNAMRRNNIVAQAIAGYDA